MGKRGRKDGQERNALNQNCMYL